LFFFIIFIFQGRVVVVAVVSSPPSSTVLLSRVDRVWDFLDVYLPGTYGAEVCCSEKKKCLLVYTWTHVSAHRSPTHITGSSVLFLGIRGRRRRRMAG
jgi:hypothetical protein